MSLQYEKEAEVDEIADEQNENVQRATPVFPLYSIVLIVCLIAVSICQFLIDGQEGVFFGGENSILLAGFDKQLFIAGQYWRMLTGTVLHGGLIHLAFNCYALYILGKLIEVLSNRAHLAIVFLLAAVGGSFMSLYFLPEGRSVGASGGIIGFLGYLTVYGFKRRKLLPDAFLKNMLFNVAFIAFVGVFVLPNVDNFGHLGGLLTGAVYGFLQIPGDVYKDPREIGSLTEISGVVALGIVIATTIFSILVLLKIL
ncbi:MAG TPA: rhomboid family intramembrane serine protease [Pyrinomonadaceae bacterium]|jgi:rhomboid protease GluP